ncbi:MAG TPA: hypothetical protein VFZ78_03715 [Flavisolibacter sp.]
MLPKKLPLVLFVCVALVPAYQAALSQQITGVWHGKIDRKRVELKIIQNGDSLTGTAYYYESPAQFRRYSIRGYFDPMDNSVVWWDDQLIRERGNHPNKTPLLSVADFNCPGGGKMFLEGKASPKDDRGESRGNVSLTKVNGPSFPDEWDYILENYLVGGNDPYLIDSIGRLAATPKPEAPVMARKDPEPPPGNEDMVVIPAPPAAPGPAPVAIPEPEDIREKFTKRKNVFKLDIPVEGEYVELSFYDNAQVDGDSISLFLNGDLIFHHIRLTDKPYTIRLKTSDLQDTNELVMVAENLGSIPPNTSYMVAICNKKRYEAQLASTENSSAMIRLRKQ